MSRLDTFAFICGCLAENLSDRAREPFRSHVGAIDWRQFVAMAGESLVAPALLAAARGNRLDDLLPREVADYLDGMAALNRLRNARIRAQIEDIGAVFASVGVVPVLIKGAAYLMGGIYDDPGARMMTDIDVVVPRARLGDCVDALQRADFSILTDNAFPAHHHFPPLGRRDDVASLELHVDALDAPYGALLPAAEVLASAVPLPRDPRFSLPPVEMQLIIAVAHAQLANHGYLYGDLPLRDLLDTARLCRHAGAIDWAGLARRFAEHGAETALACQLVAAGELLRLPLPPDISIGRRARKLHALAMKQVDYPRLKSVRTRLLRVALLFRRSLSSGPLRARFAHTIRDPAWLARHLRLLLGKGPG